MRQMMNQSKQSVQKPRPATHTPKTQTAGQRVHEIDDESKQTFSAKATASNSHSKNDDISTRYPLKCKNGKNPKGDLFRVAARIGSYVLQIRGVRNALSGQSDNFSWPEIESLDS